MNIETTKKLLNEIYEKVKNNKEGEVASYIPQLSKVNPDLFGISACTVNGEIIEIGDTNFDFCLQSCSKPLTYCIAREKLGKEAVHNCVGYEPSGREFNSFVLNRDGLPHNPMINAGAIMIASLLMNGKEPSDRFELIKKYYTMMSGNIGKIGFDNSVFLSEKQHADRNISLAYYMRENNAFEKEFGPNDISEILDLYFQCCSITITAKIGSVIAATLANCGTCPITKEEIFSSDTVRDCLSLMYQCGFYDFSGQFAFEIGLPGKSGVSGCVFLVIPNRMGVCIWSPRLDIMGNSVRGVEVCREIIAGSKSKFHIFHNMTSKEVELDYAKIDVDRLIQMFITAASNDDLEKVKDISEHLDVNKGDYDRRTALHLAASEGHFDVVEFLISKGAKKDVKDRWGNTPYTEACSHEDADNENFTKIKDILKT